jgi:hypothetical protein
MIHKYRTIWARAAPGASEYYSRPNISKPQKSEQRANMINCRCAFKACTVINHNLNKAAYALDLAAET